MSEKKFIKGLYVKPPHAKAPDFVKCSLSFRINDLQEFLSSQQGEWVNIDVKVSQKGDWYAELNDWKPDPSKQKHAEKKADGYAPERKAFVDDEIPF